MEGSATATTPSTAPASVAELHHALSDTDAIMQPRVAALVREFVELGGKREDVVVALSSGYRGTAEACNLLASWLRDVGVQQDSIGVTLQETIAEHLRGVYDPSVTRHVFQTNSKVIAWMDFMVTRPAWRALLYELRDKHKTDAVLGLAMSTIERHGHQDELATFLLGFRLFNNALVQSVSKMVARDAGEEELARFRTMCAQSPNAYMYAQLVLLNASQLDSAGSARLMRLYWELERLAIAEHPSSRVVPRLGFLLMGVFGGSHRELALGIVAMLEAGESNPADLLKIHRAYSAPNPPPVRFLRNQRLLAMLVDDVFSPTKELAAKWADKYIYCVAYACAVADSGDASMLAPTQQAIEVASRVAKQNLFGPQLEEHMPLLQHYVASFPVVAKGLLHWIRANVCDRAYFEKGTHSLSLARFISLVVDICATQPRQRAECVELLQSAYDTVESAQAQEGLLGEAASVKTHLLNALVRTMLVGDGNVVSAILKWTQQLTQRSTTDTAIMRQYVKQLFASVAPPYGAPFVEYVAVMLDYCVPATSDAAYVQQLMRTFQTNPSVAASSLLTRFLADTVSSARGKSELTPRAAQLLNSIVERLEPSRPVPRPVPLKAPAPSSSAAVAERKGPAKITLKPLVKTEEPARARRPRASARSSKASAQAVAVVVKARATASTAASTAKKVSAKPPKRKKPKRDMIDDDDEEHEDGDFIVGEEDPSAEDDGGDDDDDADERDLGDADDADDDDLGVEVDYDEVASSDDADSQSRGRHKAPVKKRATRPRPATRASAKQSGLSLTLPTALLPPKPAPKEEAYLDDNDILLFDAE